jgi:hypothetical protein
MPLASDRQVNEKPFKIGMNSQNPPVLTHSVGRRPKVLSWIEKIVTLLNHHQIQTSQSGTQLWVLMQDKDLGHVHWAIMKEMPRKPLQSSRPT